MVIVRLNELVNPVTHDLTVGAFLNFRFALLETRILTDGALGNGVNLISKKNLIFKQKPEAKIEAKAKDKKLTVELKDFYPELFAFFSREVD